MVSRRQSSLAVPPLGWLVPASAPLAAQAPAPTTPLRLSFADAVRLASGEVPAVALATLRTNEAGARGRQGPPAPFPAPFGVGGRADPDLHSQVPRNGLTDVPCPRAPRAPAQGLLLVAKNQLARGRIDVPRARGLDPATPLAFTDSLAPSLGAADVPVQRDSAVTAALATRPDLRAELARAAAARQTGSAIRAERLPRLEVAGDYGVNGKIVPKAIATRDITLQVSVPILDGFRRAARLSEQDAVVQESQVRESDLRRQIAAEVDAALLDLASAQAQQAVAREQLRLAGNIDVITAQAGLIRARDTEIDARFAAAAARISLARAAGVARTLH